jgi:hypothetical protein
LFITSSIGFYAIVVAHLTDSSLNSPPSSKTIN